MKALEEMSVVDIDKRLYSSASNIIEAIKSNLGNTRLGIELSDVVVKEFNKATLHLQEYPHEEDFNRVNADKRIWKCKLFCSSITSYYKERDTDARELTVDEAINWRNSLLGSHITFKVYKASLFYKKDDEWVLYEIDAEKNKAAK